MNYHFDLKRPLSWSSISSFEYNRDEWFKRYILKEKSDESPEMLFGKLFADSCENKKPLAPVTIYSRVEYPLSVMFGDIPLVGFIDSYEPHSKLCEFKTGKKAWTQKRVDEHGQIDMYLLQLYIQHKVKPEDIQCRLEWIPTKQNGDFSIDFVMPIKVHGFDTKRSMHDILSFGAKINRIYKEMQDFTKQKVDNL